MSEVLKIFPESIKWMLGHRNSSGRLTFIITLAILSSCFERGTHAHNGQKPITDYLLGSRPEIKQQFNIKIFLDKKIFLLPLKYGSHA